MSRHSSVEIMSDYDIQPFLIVILNNGGWDGK
jgi:hypothetical protein